ncbi:hypothetical protein [Neobacillus sp. 19]|uniref:hypothetical protein n=1 Tax=Neobacillus sp. 19 TaxID=3394458 RepID=UPI003BF72DEA
MSIDLLTKLEEEKDQWIFRAITRFNKDFLHFDGEMQDELTAVKPPENQIMQIKNILYSIYKQKKLDLERMEKEIKRNKDRIEEAEKVYRNLTMSAQYLQEDITHYEGLLTDLGQIQLEKFTCELYKKFQFDPKKDQVVVKERKTSKLNKSFKEAEWEMTEFYREQLVEIARKIKQMLPDAAPSLLFDFQSTPPLIALSLKHGRGLDRYFVPKNFEEDYKILRDTLNENNTIVYNYYRDQLNHFKQKAKKELMQLSGGKKEHRCMVLKSIEEKQAEKTQIEKSMAALEEKLSRALWEWNHEMERPRKLDEILKEEFVKAVSEWQEKLFATETTDVERWVYHQYSQLILIQAERIIGHEYT